MRKCRWCRDGEAHVCPDQTQPGFTHWGSFAEYVPLPAADTNLVEAAGAISDAATAGWTFSAGHGMPSVDYPEMLALVEAGTLRPQALVERIVGLSEGARLLPLVDTAAPVGVTLIDPRMS